MKRILICPAERPGVGLLAEGGPLCTVSLLGQSLLEYWLANLAASGVKVVGILASDRPDQVAALVGNGCRWGMTVEVVPEARELTPAQALLKYDQDVPPCLPLESIAMLEHFPGLPEYPLFSTYEGCFAGMLAWLPQAKTLERVGVKELTPGVWVSSHARISPDAKLVAPCWIGQKAFVGRGATIGPEAVVEERCFIEGHAVVKHSYVRPDTFVGRYSEIEASFALGNKLINWQSSSWTEIPDPFLLCSLRNSRGRESNRWLKRLAEFYARDKAQLPIAWKDLLLNKES